MVKAETLLLEKKSSARDAEPGLSKARAAVTDRRAAIIACADKVFSEQGFQATSMSQIAALLGGSKGTLYNYFSSKEELFLACVMQNCSALQTTMSSLIREGKGLRETLFSWGKNFIEAIYSDEIMARFRTIIAEVQRAPELGEAFYDMGPKRGTEILSKFLETARADGLLTFDDSMRAARHFVSLCDSRFAKPRYSNAMRRLDPQEIETEVDHAVRVFLAAYGTPQGQQS